MYYVYILKSKTKDWYYIGLTAHIENRIKAHNSGRVRSTKPHRPYELIHIEALFSRVEARKREKQLKNGHYKRRFIGKLNHGACSSIG